MAIFGKVPDGQAVAVLVGALTTLPGTPLPFASTSRNVSGTTSPFVAAWRFGFVGISHCTL